MIRTVLLALAGALSVGTAGAAPVIDCPMAKQRYSIRSPLIDIQLDQAAKARVDAIAPALLPGFRNSVGGDKVFRAVSAITNLELLLRRSGIEREAELAGRLDASLATVRITPTARLRRCARYDGVPPRLPRVITRPAMLVFDKTTGYRDEPSVRAARASLQAMAARRHWTLVFTDNGAVFNARDLARFNAVIWNNVSGDVLTLDQRKAFQAYIIEGGGYAGFHGSGGDPVYWWDWYVNSLLGARFTGHTIAPHIQSARIVTDLGKSSVTRGLPGSWTMSDEWYSFAHAPHGPSTRVAARLDENSYKPVGFGGADLRMGDHPIAWTRCVGRGRSFYSAIGHRPESYEEPNSLRLMEQGIGWAADVESSDTAGEC